MNGTYTLYRADSAPLPALHYFDLNAQRSNWITAGTLTIGPLDTLYVTTSFESRDSMGNVLGRSSETEFSTFRLIGDSLDLSSASIGGTWLGSKVNLRWIWPVPPSAGFTMVHHNLSFAR